MALLAPVALKHARQAMNDNVQKAADDQTQQTGEQNKGQRLAGQILKDWHELNHGTQLEDGQVHGDDQATNQNTQD